jgi:hypothetical protein
MSVPTLRQLAMVEVAERLSYPADRGYKALAVQTLPRGVMEETDGVVYRWIMARTTNETYELLCFAAEEDEERRPTPYQWRRYVRETHYNRHLVLDYVAETDFRWSEPAHGLSLVGLFRRARAWCEENEPRHPEHDNLGSVPHPAGDPVWQKLLDSVADVYENE